MSGSLGTPGSLPASVALPLIAQYESGGRNVLTGIQPPPGVTYTASGYYQIIDSTWLAAAKQAGVDTSVYPTAMSAPMDVQTQVATQLYNQYGFQPWAGNAALTAAVQAAGGSVPGAAGGTSVPAPAPLGTLAGGASGGGTWGGGIVSSFLDPVWEVASRFGLLLGGFALVMLALAAMLFHSQSETVQVRENA